MSTGHTRPRSFPFRLKRKQVPNRTEGPTWTAERLFLSGDVYFSTLVDALDHAQVSIDFEMYIFAHDEIGDRIAEALVNAAQRNIAVRLVVDGIGSAGWVGVYGPRLNDAGVIWKVYNELPWESLRYSRKYPRLFAKTSSLRQKLLMFLRGLGELNKRNHRKLILVDKSKAFVGSRNITKVHSESLQGKGAWRDTSLAVEGPAIFDLSAAFERTWRKSKWHVRRPLSLSPILHPNAVRLNDTLKARLRNYRDLCRRIRKAKHRVWITTAYFVPHRSLIRALSLAADHGVDVRILVPSKSDVFFMPWVTTAFLKGLLKAGARIYEYLPSVLHAKTILIDDWQVVGSSNLNHRSLFHDLEVDCVVTTKEVTQALEASFLDDLNAAQELTASTWDHRTWLARIGGNAALFFRHWL